MFSQGNVNHLYTRAGICHVVLDAEGTVLKFNSTAESVFKTEAEEIIGKNFRIFSSADTAEELDKMLKTCMRRGFIKDEVISLAASDGSGLWLKVNGKSEGIEDNNDSAMQLYLVDYTAVKRAERKNRLLLSLLRTESIGPGDEATARQLISDLKDITGAESAGIAFADGTIITCSAGAGSQPAPECSLPLPEWKKCTVLYKNYLGLNTDSGGALCIENIPDLISSSLPDELANVLFRFQSFRNLTVFYNTGDAGESCLFFLDNFESGLDEEQILFLEAATTVFRKHKPVEKGEEPDKPAVPASLENPVSGIIITKKGRIIDVNDWVLQFTGFKKDDLLNKSFNDLIPESYQTKVKQLAESRASDTSLTGTVELTIQDASGKDRNIECGYRYIPMNGNSLDMWYIIDKQDKHWLQKQLLQARKMESLGLLSGGIVHDFNNLMSSILGYSSLLTEELKETDPYYDDVRQIHLTSEKATELTSRLMAYAHDSAYVISDLDVNQLVTEVAGILSRTLDKNIMIRAELAPDIKRITADASQVQQAILQVALNARDAMPSGGKIIFSTRNIHVKENSAWIKQGASPGDYIQIAVSDTGRGMSVDIKEQMFTPHFTTKKGESGKGLGLSMVHEIVSNHQGFISVFSEVGKGTILKFHFPAHQAGMSNDTMQDAKPVLGKETILLVDVEKNSRETARKMLTRYGYKVISAETGRDAAAIYKKYSDRVDLIILDTLMPGINTSKIILHFKQINPDIRIIGSSAKGESGQLETAVKEKIEGVVTKPFQLRPLLQSIRTVLNA
ncbi:PAS domain S-box protein [bacterium]|nr:PAS domain S-box protein [bacterium]